MVEPGLIVLLGSAEVEPTGGESHDAVARRFPERPRIAILETAAGFEPTSALMAGAVKHFLQRRLQRYEPLIDVLPARRRGTAYSPDNPDVVAPLLEADAVVLGPGSATYAVSQLRNSLALQALTARQRQGAALILSSAAAMAFSTFTLPVYEPYEAGEARQWKQGLDYFGHYELPLTVVPHWNNGKGGGERDTSRCYMGRERFRRLHAMLPAAHPILGIDEDAALLFDFARGSGYVQGTGGVTYLRNGINRRFPAGSNFPLGLLGLWAVPHGRAGIPQAVWEQTLRAETASAQGETGMQPAPRPSAD